MSPRPDEITDRERKFVREYLTNGFNHLKAAQAAGYKLTGGSGKNLLKRARVVREIERLTGKTLARYEVTIEWIIERMAERADAGRILARFKKVDDEGNIYHDFTGATEEELRVIDEVTVEEHKEGRGDTARTVRRSKVKGANPDVSLLTLARHRGMLSDKLTGENTGASLVERLQAGRNRAKLKKQGD